MKIAGTQFAKIHALEYQTRDRRADELRRLKLENATLKKRILELVRACGSAAPGDGQPQTVTRIKRRPGGSWQWNK